VFRRQGSARSRLLQIVELALDLRNPHELHALLVLQLANPVGVFSDGGLEWPQFR
jgi:hypothetical protein